MCTPTLGSFFVTRTKYLRREFTKSGSLCGSGLWRRRVQRSTAPVGVRAARWHGRTISWWDRESLPAPTESLKPSHHPKPHPLKLQQPVNLGINSLLEGTFGVLQLASFLARVSVTARW